MMSPKQKASLAAFLTADSTSVRSPGRIPDPSKPPAATDHRTSPKMRLSSSLSREDAARVEREQLLAAPSEETERQATGDLRGSTGDLATLRAYLPDGEVLSSRGVPIDSLGSEAKQETSGSSSKTPRVTSFTPAQAMPHQATILGLVFLDLFAVGLAMPLVIPLIRDLGADPIELGILSSTYGMVQLFSGPFMGLLSDRRGRRLVILISCLGTSAGYFLLGLSTSIIMVAWSRVITGLLKHSINATKAYIADHTSGTNRAIELGRMATASGLGIMVGPAVGGFLFKLQGYWLPTTLASIIYIINSAIVLNKLPPNELPPAIQKAAAMSPQEPLTAKQFLPRVTMLARPRVAALFAVRAVLGLAIQVFRQGFAARLIYSLKLGVQSNGLLLSYQGALTSLVQGFAIKPLVQRYNDEPLILRGMLLLSVSFVACSLSPSVILVALTLTPVALATGVLRTTYTALLTASVAPVEVGQLLGLSDAVMSGCRVMGPTLAGLVAQKFGHAAPGFLSGFITVLATIIFQLFVHHSPVQLLREKADSWGKEEDSPSLPVRHAQQRHAEPRNLLKPGKEAGHSRTEDEETIVLLNGRSDSEALHRLSPRPPEKVLRSLFM